MKKILLLLIFGAILLTAARFLADLFERNVDRISQSEDFAAVLDQKTDKVFDLIYETQKAIRTEGAKRTQLKNEAYYERLFQEDGIMLSVFRKDELILWTSNSISPVNLQRIASGGTEIYRFDNGWYRLIYLTNGVDEYCGAILIKRNFPYENAFLDNAFQKDFKQEALVGIDTKSKPGSVKMKARFQSFYLVYDFERSSGLARAIIFLAFSFAGALMVAFALGLLAIRAKTRISDLSTFILLTVVACLLRYLSLHGGWPEFVNDMGMFNPAIYASSSLFPSLLDLCLNALLLLLLAAAVRYIFIRDKLHQAAWRSKALLFLGLLLLMLYGAWINNLTKGLVLDSNIPFDINNIVSINAYTFVAIAASALLFASFFLIADRLRLYAHQFKMDSKMVLLYISIAILLNVLISHALGIRDLFFVLWPPILLLITFLPVFFGFDFRGKTQGWFVFSIVFFAAIASHNFIKYNKVREHSERLILSEKLAVDYDPVAELLYSDMARALARDPDVREVFEEDELHTRETLEDYVLSRYFTGYWGRYDIKMYAFTSDSSIWGKLPTVRPTTFGELQARIDQFGEPSEMNKGLYFMYNSADLTTYMSVLPLHYSLSKSPDGYLIFELKSKLFPQQLGFPALLIDNRSKPDKAAANYANARYVNQQLISSAGDYPFQSHPGSFAMTDKTQEFVSKRGYEHLVSKVDKNTIVVISKKSDETLSGATTFSYLCVIFGVLLAFFLMLRALFVKNAPLELNLNQKIQALLLVLILGSLCLYAFATRYYIEEKYTEKNQRQISEKMQSILLEMQSKLGEEEVLNYDISDLLNRYLSQFSYIFFTDINIYSPEGSLLASSQMRMFNEGLLSRRMNPEAFAHMSYLDQVEFIHDEQIGKMTYLSGYTPFYNSRGELLAYLNLPYFAKQTELDGEISSFLVSVINIFVLLFLFSIFIGLFTSQWITAPLRTVREGLAGIELGKTNRPIAYKGSDEIGRLVQEYNAKVAELEQNAEKLAQSERESAWREMAKQVAHEIKNPLTPMKLSVQHLERSIEQSGTVDKAQVKRMAANLIEQINALSGIATAFSNFARMPQAKEEVFDLSQMLNNAVELFDGFSNIDFKLDLPISNTFNIKADKEQMLRVFNNLITNAVQSCEDVHNSEITISLRETESAYRISIADNGSGIADVDRGRIFVPNFTTKSKGMGLGLAMAKNIVENSGGKIWFESTADSGSIFYVELPSA